MNQGSTEPQGVPTNNKSVLIYRSSIDGIMRILRLLIVNYQNTAFVRELTYKGYDITVASTRESRRLIIDVDLSDFDLIYFAKFSPPQWDDSQFVFHRAEAPVIYAFHSNVLIPNAHRFTNYAYNFLSAVKLAWIKLARTIDAFHVLNTREQRILTRLGFRSFCVPLGVDSDRFKLVEKDKEFKIVFISPRYQKGADLLPRIVPEILKRAPSCKFILSGRGFLTQYFTSLKESFNDNVEVCERLPDDQLASLLGSANVLLFPSRYETFGSVVLEALCCGSPIVCFDIAGAPRDILKTENVSVIASPFDIRKTADGVVFFYRLWREDAGGYQFVSSECRRIALRYDWRIVSDHFDHMFRGVLRNQKRNRLPRG